MEVLRMKQVSDGWDVKVRDDDGWQSAIHFAGTKKSPQPSDSAIESRAEAMKLRDAAEDIKRIEEQVKEEWERALHVAVDELSEGSNPETITDEDIDNLCNALAVKIKAGKDRFKKAK